MTKIPVFKTVADAYVFTFNNLGVIAGLIWIPMLALTLLGFFAQATYLTAMTSFLATNNPADMGPGVMWMLLLMFAWCLALAMMLVPVLQQALGTRKEHAFGHLALGQPEWRMFGSYLTVLGIFFALVIVLVALSGLFASGILTLYPKGAAAPAVNALLQLIVLALVVACAVGFLRLAFLIPAIAVVEEKRDLIRGWTLIKGNMLRLTGIVLLLIIPVSILFAVFEIAAFGLEAAAAHSLQPSVADLQLLRKELPLTEAFRFFVAPLTIGLIAGAVASVYRTLVLSPKPELPPQ